MSNFNSYLFTLIYQGSGQYPVLDGFFVILTTYITYAVVGLTLLYLVAYPFFTSDPFSWTKRLGVFVETAVSLFVAGVIGLMLKVTIALPRPFVTLENIKPLIHEAPYQSFPSLHAALTMALAIAVLPYHKHLGHLLIAFSLVVAMSRIFVGVHYPFDVGVGLLIGYLVPKIIHRIFGQRRAVQHSSTVV